MPYRWLNPMNPPSVTPFQQRVYDATRRIPRGKVTTYADLARAIGCRSARAVGQALRRNPFAPEVPCHRVVASDFHLGGFNGRTDGAELDRKKRMLESEGVGFTPAGSVAPGCLWRVPGGQGTARP